MERLARSLGLVILASALVGCGLVGGSSASPTPAGGADALQRGLAAHTAGKLDEATAAYFEALSKDPTNRFAFFNLGEIAHRKNLMVQAESWYRLALESDRNMTSALYNLALVRQAVGDGNEAVSLLRRLITLEPNNGSAHYNLGIAYRSLGQNDNANTEFATAQRLDSRLVPPTGSARPSPTR